MTHTTMQSPASRAPQPPRPTPQETTARLKARPVERLPESAVAPPGRPRFLSEADCHDIADRLARLVKGGGYSAVTIVSTWRGNVRWARNMISTSGEDRNDHVVVSRNLRGAINDYVELNNTTDEALLAAARRAERLAHIKPERQEYDYAALHMPHEPYQTPHLFFDSTYQQDAAHRADAAERLAQQAAQAGMLSAGYIEVVARSVAYINSLGYARYFPYTWAQYSVTVRDPKGTGSGWAGIDWPDWKKIDGEQLSAIALDKCLRSRNPVAIEPGRYTTILEPQAVCDFVGQLVFENAIERWNPSNGGNEAQPEYPFNKEQGGGGWSENDSKHPGFAKLGEKVIDERLSIRADPMDPDVGFPPFAPLGNDWTYFADDTSVYHAAQWITNGVLTQMSYPRQYAVQYLGQPTGLPNSGAFRMDVTGPTSTLDEMIAATKRGLLVTRFDRVERMVMKSQLYRGYTRDGLWLIENGKVSKPVKNMAFVESILFALNNVEQVGVPQRTFHPMGTLWPWTQPQPVIVPALQVRDFSFTALVDAV